MAEIAMVRFAGVLVGAWALTGCSILYDPGKLPGAAIDARIDAVAVTDAGDDNDTGKIFNPGDLNLESAGPLVLYEGQGTGGSRAAILVIEGVAIWDDAVVALLPTNPEGNAPLIEVDNEHAVRADSTKWIAVPVTLPIDVARGAGDIPLTVQVSQLADGVMKTKTLVGQVTLHTLPELDDAPASSAALAPMYSRVAINGPLTFAARAGAPAVVIRSVSSIKLRDVHADASLSVAGAGGAAGGATGLLGSGPGGGRPGGLLSGGVIVSGSGGGYSTAGSIGHDLLGNPNAGGIATGDELFVQPVNGSSGGGGGGVNPGGGGGGSIELTAGGTLETGDITANGAAGGASGTLAGPAGGGSGGKILLRAGATATIGKVTANGGIAGSGPPAAGAGAGGRLRYDVGALAGSPALPPANRRGVSFNVGANDNPLITRDANQGFALTSAVSANTSTNLFEVYVFNTSESSTAMTNVTFVTPGAVVKPGLSPGFNRVCVTPKGQNPLTAVAVTNCIDVAYVP